MTTARKSGSVHKPGRVKPIVAAFVTAVIANLVGVLLFFKPISDGDTSFVSVHPAVGLLVYVALCIALMEWANRQMSSVYKAAFIVAAPQFILVADLTLSGKRGSLTAAAGTVLLAATWVLVAFIYSLFDGKGPEEGQRA